MRSAADGVTGAAEDQEDQADEQHDDAERPQQRTAGDDSDEEEDESEDDHAPSMPNNDHGHTSTSSLGGSPSHRDFVQNLVEAAQNCTVRTGADPADSGLIELHPPAHHRVAADRPGNGGLDR